VIKSDPGFMEGRVIPFILKTTLLLNGKALDEITCSE
jgi:hypothetical protein